jgi:DNA/RNA endonuclease YhcR with UshA esterase domain
MLRLPQILASAVLGLLICIETAASDVVNPSDAVAHVGNQVAVCGVVSEVRHVKSAKGSPIFINFGGSYPNHRFTAVAWEKNSFVLPPEWAQLAGASLCVSGRVELYRGRAEIELTSPAQISRQTKRRQ